MDYENIKYLKEYNPTVKLLRLELVSTDLMGLWDNIIPWTNLTPYNLPLKAQLLEYDIVQIVSLRIL